ncbi:MAG TPA: ABC transporter permease [Candidatus Cottocaccamicrobium excrementipullorum]|nr:ABC transporter permease [Candidatus Cottocaccamicrobium excrementipullorum]
MIFPFRKPAPPAASPKISPAQRSFLCRQQRKRRLVLICRGFLFLLLIGMWETASRLSWIDRFIFSSPSLILNCLWSMVLDGSLFLHTGVTLGETLLSFALVISIGLGAALILWLSPTLAQILEPYLVILNSLPKSALAPLLIVWLGNNTKTIITAAVSVALFGSIMTLHTGFSQTDPDKIRLIYSLGGKKTDVLAKVLLPASIPLIISNMKVNIGLCLVGVIIGEFLSSRAGLGYLIIYSSQVFQMTVLVSSIIVLCIMSVVLYQGIAWVEKKFLA